MKEQQRRAAERQLAQRRRYPDPPTYADQWERRPRTQPVCYELSANPFEAALIPWHLLKPLARV